jgi:hypothetical protein
VISLNGEEILYKGKGRPAEEDATGRNSALKGSSLNKFNDYQN